MKKLKLMTIFLVVFVCGLSAITAQAVPILFQFTGVGSGSLDAMTFTDASFEVAIVGDTANVQPYPRPDPDPTTPSILNLSGTIDISGVGVGSFVNPLYVFDNQTVQGVGFGEQQIHYDLIDLYGAGVGLDTYGLTTSFGPITDPDPFFGQFNNVALNIGELTFTGVSSATFTATTNVIPAPGAILLGSIGIGLVGWLRRRRTL